MSKVEFVCVAPMGVVVPNGQGSFKTLKEGDRVEGEYYEKIAERVPGLRRVEELSKEEIAKLQRKKEIREGKHFPDQFKQAMEDGGRGYDPVLDRGTGNPLDNLTRAVQEAKGSVRASEDGGPKPPRTPMPADGGDPA